MIRKPVGFPNNGGSGYPEVYHHGNNLATI
jgi:hypothetical protein